MKIHHRRHLFCAVFLLSLVASIAATPVSADTVASKDVTESTLKTGTKSNPVGTEHAPVDGKDGIPHEGPWVETSAERERKKAKTSLDDDNSLSHTTHTQMKDYQGEVSHEKIPQSNEGVMDDKSRSGPIEGTRGTEGGITQKSKNKDTISVDQKRPDAPKEQPPLPHSEKEKLKTTEGLEDSDKVVLEDDSRKLLGKPTDLPEKPHSLPLPENPSSPKDNVIPAEEHRLSNHPSASRTDAEGLPGKEDIVQPLHSMFLAFTMIMFSEIGDKTFLVACLMAMRHDRLLVFSAAFSALIAMTILSAVLGHAVPTLIPKWLTNFLAAGLFLVFGVKMLLEARNISPDEGVSEEMKEVEQELEEKEHEALRKSRRRSSVSPYVLESGRGGIRKSRSEAGRLPSPPDSPISETSSRSSSPSRRSTIRSITAGINNLFSLLLSPAWVQTFVMTFLGEWGDRSQIATIAMAAGSDYWWVTGGALCGHAICTGVAVVGGKAIAGKVSLRTVTMGGAIAFLVFGVVYLLEAIY
ncbi:GCR1-dependent translation factor 1 [Knufia obscura]|uniref:GCR1-dependent translation factor 1 n=2 Tax=Knufia TaxID=430999 RepID=A0AAN8I5K2_9EURO|nr:GCR1-dependent translation factor 1 [Knufia obscura]KAK5950481.1 GCR1-dependent translation factor 1 [Knufia fluminis]